MKGSWRKYGLTLLAVGFLANGEGCRRGRAGNAERRPIFWVMDESPDNDLPTIRFHFAPPHDAYAGEVRRVQGAIHFDDEFRLGRDGGWFSVDVTNVTLGEPDLDENVRNNVEFLFGKQFPVSKYVIRSITAGRERIQGSSPVEITLHGDFQLKGVTIPLSVPAKMEYAKDSRDASVLLMSGSFSLEKLRETYGISGPGHENDPAGNRLTFEFHFTLVRGNPKP